MTSLITGSGGALNFDSATWPVALRWLSKTGWRIHPADTGPGQMPRINVAVVDQVEPAHGLSAREMQVLIGMSEGKSNAKIGEGIHLSEETVKTYARRLFRRLGANDRAHAVAIAFRMGILGGPQ